MNIQNNNDLSQACARARREDEAAIASERRETLEDLQRIEWLRNKPLPAIYEPPKQHWKLNVCLAAVMLLAGILGGHFLPNERSVATARTSPLETPVRNFRESEVRRAEPVVLSHYQAPPVIGCVYTATLPDVWGGAKIPVTFRGIAREFKDIPPFPAIGDMWAALDTPGQSWIYTTPPGYSWPIWIDP
jgi:hypothetical protein